jgi:metal-sulfur cluster biosynthetic enzyme
MIRHINDPEHPLTLEQLNVAQLKLIKVDHSKNHVFINFTPTVPHCSMATLIGLSIRVKLLRSLPSKFKIDVEITPGTHSSEHAGNKNKKSQILCSEIFLILVNKQLNDKERVAAAMENSHLLAVVNKCIAHTDS